LGWGVEVLWQQAFPPPTPTLPHKGGGSFVRELLMTRGIIATPWAFARIAGGMPLSGMADSSVSTSLADCKVWAGGRASNAEVAGVVQAVRTRAIRMDRFI
jgi:hypothetical protein